MTAVYQWQPGEPTAAPDTWGGVLPQGCVVAAGSVTQALYRAEAGVATITGAALTRIDAGLTLDAAEALLCDGLDLAALLALVGELGVDTRATTLGGLRSAVRRHLEGLADE